LRRPLRGGGEGGKGRGREREKGEGMWRGPESGLPRAPAGSRRACPQFLVSVCVYVYGQYACFNLTVASVTALLHPTVSGATNPEIIRFGVEMSG